MQPTLTRQPDGMNSGSTPGHDPDRFAGHEFNHFNPDMLVVNRIGADDHDDGLVHNHEWAADK